jgi:hypothetical protein
VRKRWENIAREIRSAVGAPQSTANSLRPLLRYTPSVSPREFFFENFAGDLGYHPRRAVLYLFLAIAAAAFWLFSPAETKFTATPRVLALGALTLLTKDIAVPGETS